jgi:hypothetical protein
MSFTFRLARLLHSTNNWERPSGAQRVEGFTMQHGFGYEEWLNNNLLTDKAERYGFLECLFERVPRGDYSKILLFTYHQNLFKIVGIIYHLEYIPVHVRNIIEESLIAGNEDTFQHDILNVGGLIPNEPEGARFRINFSVKEANLLILEPQSAISIGPSDYPNLYRYFMGSRFFRLRILYRINNSYIQEMSEIEERLRLFINK